MKRIVRTVTARHAVADDIEALAGIIRASNFFELAVAVVISLDGAASPAAVPRLRGLMEGPVMLTLVSIASPFDPGRSGFSDGWNAHPGRKN